MSTFTESIVEQAALAWLESVGWSVRNGAEIAPGEPAAEREDYRQVVLAQRLRDALARLNPVLPSEAPEDAFRRLTRPEGAELVTRNRAVHRRNAKTDVIPVDSRQIVTKLAQIPLATWRYKSQAEGIRHMGPMAQDFYAAFGLGEDEKYISTIDADGVALAAIQGLYQEHEGPGCEDCHTGSKAHGVGAGAEASGSWAEGTLIFKQCSRHAGAVNWRNNW